MAPAMLEAACYHRWVFSRLAPYIGERILEVGPAEGAFTSLLATKGAVTAVELDSYCCQALRTRFASVPHIRILHGDIVDGEIQSLLAADHFDTIVCINVLEHLVDDMSVLRAFGRVLQPASGRLALFVPAHPTLYGWMDRQAGHHRRYTRAGLAQAIKTAGFDVVCAQYFNVLGFFGWFVNGRLLPSRDLGSRDLGWQIRLFDRLGVPVAATLERMLPIPFGQSLIAIGHVAEGSRCSA
jgi:SAM-dependent methyltransferase